MSTETKKRRRMKLFGIVARLNEEEH